MKIGEIVSIFGYARDVALGCLVGPFTCSDVMIVDAGYNMVRVSLKGQLLDVHSKQLRMQRTGVEWVKCEWNNAEEVVSVEMFFDEAPIEFQESNCNLGIEEAIQFRMVLDEAIKEAGHFV